MEQNSEKAVTTAKEVRGVPFKKGDDPRRNIDGRPQGSLDFKTKWYKMIDKIAEVNDITSEEVELELIKVGYKRAKDGDYSFYRDAMDRIHGKPVQPSEVEVKGNLTIQFAEEFKNKDEKPS